MTTTWPERSGLLDSAGTGWPPEPLTRIYGPAGQRDRGGIIAFNLLDPGGRVVGRAAERRAAQ